MTRFLIPLLALSLLTAGVHAKSAKPVEAKWSIAEKRLAKAGFKKKFISALKKTYEPETFREVLELNTLLFLKKSDYHGVQVNAEAAEDVRKFMTENKGSLKVAEKKYGVPGEVVASLLWIESRHGKNLGQFHVPSVFVDLIQADRPEVLRHLHQAGTRFTAKVTAKNRRDITSRANKRVKWAVSELKAIAKMWERNPNVLKDFRGSFAGAFGMSQFLPSSYVHYAKSQAGNKPAVLENAGDAIQSVAYYLQANGWRTRREKSHMKALMRYNNSQDYANAILKLSRQISPEDKDAKRLPAGH